MTETTPRNIDELLVFVRQEAAWLDSREQRVTVNETLAPRAHAVPVWAAEPGEKSAIKISYHVNEFLIYDDLEFVANAYRCIMRREADESGLDTYTILLRTEGNKKKIPILLNLLDSDEARVHKVRIRGMRWESWRENYLNRRWFIRPLRACFDIAQAMLKNDQQEYTLFTDRERRAHEARVNAYLSSQQKHFAYRERRDEELQIEHQAVNEALHQERRELAMVRQDLLLQQQRLNVLLDQVQGGGTAALIPGKIDNSGKLDSFYIAFENECRGDEAVVREQLSCYLPRLRNCAALNSDCGVLDVGSGRGEWLSLLRDEGIVAAGVDSSPLLAAHCHVQDLNVTIADAASHLLTLPDASQAVVTGFHIIEHLPFDTLFALIEQCYRVVAPGGLVIFETPNPENTLVGSHTFYHDPTHRNPITPTLVEFLVRYLGFADTEIVRLHPYPESERVPGLDQLTERVNGQFCSAQDFAIVARRP